MGAYNTVTASVTCPRCGAQVEATIQFKYGDVWQHSYRLNDELEWGGNDTGKRGADRVVVEGVAEEPCPACGVDDEWDLCVYLERDKITRVESATGEHNFLEADSSFIVLVE